MWRAVPGGCGGGEGTQARGWGLVPLLVAGAGPWELFTDLTFRASETQALSTGWWAWDSRLIGGKSFIKDREINNNLTSSEQFSIS